VFCPSARADLAKALKAAGRFEEVVAFGDDLSFGPIDPPDVTIRDAWIERELGWTDWNDLAPDLDAFWANALADNRRRIVWLSRRSSLEYCGFLEWLGRNDLRPFELVDLTDVSLQKRADGTAIPAPVTSLIRAEQFLSAHLWDSATTPTRAAVADWMQLWRKLRRENAALRLLSPEGLYSAPIAALDAAILSCVEEDWCKAALVVGRFLD
jgi:hypothetical protein